MQPSDSNRATAYVTDPRSSTIVNLDSIPSPWLPRVQGRPHDLAVLASLSSHLVDAGSRIRLVGETQRIAQLTLHALLEVLLRRIPLSLLVLSLILASPIRAQATRSYEGLDRNAVDGWFAQTELSLDGRAGNANHVDLGLAGRLSYRTPAPGHWLRFYPSWQIRRSERQSMSVSTEAQIPVSEQVDLVVSWSWRRDSRPPADIEADDHGFGFSMRFGTQ